MDTKQPKVTLLSWTNNPLETVYAVWEASKTEDPLRTPEEIQRDVLQEEIEELFRAIIAQRIPIGEHIDFVFMLEGVSISFREQMVRHRIGVKPSLERVGVDMVMSELPNLADSSWWSQSMRIQSMDTFASKGRYRIADSILEHSDPMVKHTYQEVMKAIELGYATLVEAGIPMEDARDLIPLGAHHRISWKLNFSALQHIIGKRSCWILQLGLWGPVIMGMVQEMTEKVHPVFHDLATPPCIKGDEFGGCVFMEECRRRLDGEDQLPPCPMHFNYHHPGVAGKGITGLLLPKIDIPMKKVMMARMEQYAKFWHRDPFTGERLTHNK